MTMKTMRIVGWIICGLLSLLLIFSSVMKFTITEEQMAQMPDMGWQRRQFFTLGIIELTCTLLFILPTRVSFLGLVLLTAYMGGAVAAHVRMDELPILQVIIGVLLWVGYCMAHPEVFRAAFGIPPASSSSS
jgi:DoxX-like family